MYADERVENVRECVSVSVRVCGRPPRGCRGVPGFVSLATARAGLSAGPAPARVLPRVCFPAGTGRKMGSRGLRLVLACCLLLAFAWGPALGRVPRGPQELPEQEGTREPPRDHAER